MQFAPCGFLLRLGGREIHVLDRFVDFGGALVADRDAIDAGVLERELHRLLTVLAMLKVPSPPSFIQMTPMPCLADLLHVRDDFRHVARTAASS